MTPGRLPDVPSGARWLHARLRRGPCRGTLAGLYFLALGLAAFLPTLGGGFVLQLDMVFAPDASYLSFALGEKGPLYYGRLPFLAALDALTLVVPDWVAQRILLVGAVAGAGAAAYAATDGLTFPGRLFAGTLYAVNPFTYVRLLAGQWYLVLGYAALPLAVVAFHDYVAGERERPTRAVAWTTVVALFDPHAAVLLAVAGVTVLAAVAVNDRRVPVGRTVRFTAIAVAVNAYWLLPAALSLGAGDSQLSTVTGADLTIFSPDGVVAGNVGLSVTMLYGFWRQGYTYPFDIVPLAVVVCLVFLLLLLAVTGWLSRDDALGDGLALAALVGALLALGVTTSLTAPLVGNLAQTPIGAGMRDTGKFVALPALAYAVLGGRGVDAVRGAVTAHLATGSRALDREPTPSQESLRRGTTVALAVCLVALPLLYTFPMVAGFWGGFTTTEYPDGWHAANERFDRIDDPGRVLVLPWHQYYRFEWTGTTVANPAPLFFGPETVASRDPEVGVGSQATDPTHRQVRAVLDSDDHETFGRAMAALGVQYVVVLRTADYRRYSYLHDQSALTVVAETPDLVVFRNLAFDDAPPPEDWPRDGPRVPVFALFAGTATSLSTGALVATRSH